MGIMTARSSRRPSLIRRHVTRTDLTEIRGPLPLSQFEFPTPNPRAAIEFDQDEDVFEEFDRVCMGTDEVAMHGAPPKKANKRLAASQALKATDPMVAVEVGNGDDAKTFHVHATQLRKSSEYLKAKAKPEWSKGKATVDLAHQDPGAFNIYVNWLYTGQILSPTVKKSHASEEWLGLAWAFTLGEELIDQNFKDAVMSALSASASDAQVTDFLDCMGEMVNIFHDGTPEGSPARKFLVDLGKSLEREQLSKLRGELHADFVFELAMAGAKDDTQVISGSRKRKRQPIGTIKEGVCEYHEHVAGKSC